MLIAKVALLPYSSSTQDTYDSVRDRCGLRSVGVILPSCKYSSMSVARGIHLGTSGFFESEVKQKYIARDLAAILT
jgi:hypothetical protein